MTTAYIGGQKKSVSNYANSAPSWLEAWEESIDEIANTHQWRHGDAKSEPFSRIRGEYLPKPGITPLMRAAMGAQVEEMRKLLAEGTDVSAADASGWTALMYGAASSSSFPIQILLDAGADPNQRSPKGDTALMASAITRMWDEDLVKARANVNTQNEDGVSALMILAATGEADEIENALKAGADPSLKDKTGRTALDYLKLANCGNSPLRDLTAEWMTIGRTRCDALDGDDFQKARELLTR